MEQNVWEVRSLDAWGNKKDGFVINDSQVVMYLLVSPGRERRHFLDEIIFKGFRRKFNIVWLYDNYAELIHRKTQEPFHSFTLIENEMLIKDIKSRKKGNCNVILI